MRSKSSFGVSDPAIINFMFTKAFKTKEKKITANEQLRQRNSEVSKLLNQKIFYTIREDLRKGGVTYKIDEINVIN